MRTLQLNELQGGKNTAVGSRSIGDAKPKRKHPVRKTLPYSPEILEMQKRN